MRERYEVEKIEMVHRKVKQNLKAMTVAVVATAALKATDLKETLTLIEICSCHACMCMRSYALVCGAHNASAYE